MTFFIIFIADTFCDENVFCVLSITSLAIFFCYCLHSFSVRFCYFLSFSCLPRFWDKHVFLIIFSIIICCFFAVIFLFFASLFVGFLYYLRHFLPFLVVGLDSIPALFQATSLLFSAALIGFISTHLALLGGRFFYSSLLCLSSVDLVLFALFIGRWSSPICFVCRSILALMSRREWAGGQSLRGWRNRCHTPLPCRDG